MRARTVALVLLLAGGGGAISWSLGQERPQPPRPTVTVQTPSSPRPVYDLARLSFLEKQVYVSAQRGMDWLQRRNQVDGRFAYVANPTLRKRQERDDFLRQAGATLALAKAARFFRAEKAAALATQAVLTLLLETSPDNGMKPQFRHTTVPNTSIHRLASTGLLLLAIHELPAPAADVLDQSEQLCNYLRRQQRSDGSLTAADQPADAKVDAHSQAADEVFAGVALYGLIRSQQHRPAAWKTEVLRRAQRHYLVRWREHKRMSLVPDLSAAFAEAYLLTKEQPFADAVFEMNDWLCTLQYQQLEPHRPLWAGGFMTWVEGKAAQTAPNITCARFAEALADACRVARFAGDAQRHARYREALERCLQFTISLQFTQANTQHFTDWYRDEILGAFHVSHDDGNLRLEHTQHAVCALVHYLANVLAP